MVCVRSLRTQQCALVDAIDMTSLLPASVLVLVVLFVVDILDNWFFAMLFVVSRIELPGASSLSGVLGVLL